ncbi:SH3 domain-containing protein [Rubrivirga sp. S365]|uniref:SH3 domain-containing protein n=1 Tax=Rubrivirga litoralis TaxID=3075598 RepID=A0ABU3BSY7_9BACT|nr:MULTISPECIES: SH3 domain-containing protein [unclassified Rubrivirga]MDT0632403.1 SH3 domain-containing protein [Rubrivirga sp. F394]MDT7855226.1 SH3 domain-containing protein [Rubrivirga sp. S365]
MAVALALLVLLQPAPRAEAERLFDVGTTLVAEGDTAGAVAAWEGALDTGWASAAAEANLGAVAHERGDVGRARLHLERAARLAPLDGDVARALADAREAAGAAPPTAAERAWRGLVGVVRPVGLVALALALAFGALALRLLGRRRPALVVSVVAAFAVAAAGTSLWQAAQADGIVLADAADVREAPSPTAPPVARVRAGERVGVGEERAGWRRVSAGGAEGWVRGGAVAAL